MKFENRSAFVAYQEKDVFASDLADDDSARADLGTFDDKIIPVVLCGGGGTRLWPFSTTERPKQFLPLLSGSKSLFHAALDRVRDRTKFTAPVVVGSERHGDLCAHELSSEGDAARLILEPCQRNTAAAIAMAASVVIEEHGPDALMLVMPSDHIIEDVDAFHSAVAKGEAAARAGHLVTFGVEPTAPHTGYGYLKTGDELPEVIGVTEVAHFVEKPVLQLAEQMLADGRHLWNAGIFLLRAGTLLDELMVHAPGIHSCARAAMALAERDGIRIRASLDALKECPSQSIDYAVMEHSSLLAVVPMSSGWSDLGSWEALAALLGATHVDGPVTDSVDSSGGQDLVIVTPGEKVLVVPRGRSQEVERLLSAMDSKAA